MPATSPHTGYVIPLSLYVHLPWCVRKCPYCDFNSHAVRDQMPEAEYVAALIRDLDFELRKPESRRIESIFFGGGTPSLFSAASIAEILQACAKRLHFDEHIEITMEANPGTAEAQRFKGYRAAGVNRLSIGLQSLDADKLRALGRIHGPEEGLRAVEMARTAGFDNFNLDLMFALPGQSLEQCMKDLDAALALSPEHLSWYHLTLEPNTEFAAFPPQVPDDDAAADMHDAGLEKLAAAGLVQYETSAFAREGRRCRHNLNYWSFGDYLGIGAGAHGKRSLRSEHGLRIHRRARHRHPKAFIDKAGTSTAVQEERGVRASELPFEFCMNALRLNEGFSVDQFEARTGLPIASLDKPLGKALDRGLVTRGAWRIEPTELGRRHQNRLIGLFLDA